MAKTALLASRAVIAVRGPEARGFLDGVITQTPPAAGGAVFAALLTPQGKILFDFMIAARDDGFYFDIRADAAEAFVKRLSMYRLRAKATIENLGDWAVAAALDGEETGAAEGVLAFPDPRLSALGRRLIGPRAAIESIADASDADYDARRLALGVPEFGADFGSDEVFLLDVNYDALNGVSYRKGCFVGQEVTSRMKRKGEIRKRTLQLVLAAAPPARGAEIRAGETIIGEVLSGAKGAGLALVRLDRLAGAKEAGAALSAGGEPVQIHVPAYLERV
ncbi:MAG: folate-binding protein [Alphaproteobacteria bacterium]|nr:folate-binding protein [Alphaproteobacteria bacterium]